MVRPFPPVSISSIYVMVADFDMLWRKAPATVAEAAPVWTLGKILPSMDSQTLISSLESTEPELCIEVTDRVCSGFLRGVSPPRIREAGIF
jgi:hypothetical protein